MNKYERLKAELDEKGTGKMKCFGDSMIPILYTGCNLTFVKQENYEIGDVVFSKVHGWWIDAQAGIYTDTHTTVWKLKYGVVQWMWV